MTATRSKVWWGPGVTRDEAHERRRAYHLDLWTASDQALYRDCINNRGMTHEGACAVVRERRAAEASDRAAVYDRQHPRTPDEGF